MIASGALLLYACAGAPALRGTPATPSPTLRSSTALLDTDEGSVVIDVEIADTEAEREQGLMGRRSLPEDQGMVFLFFEESTAGFWMKDTLIPLSIAFFDERGRIVDILDMEPCEKEPCRVYQPDSPYWGALEVNAGAFEEWGVEEGDTITIPT